MFLRQYVTYSVRPPSRASSGCASPVLVQYQPAQEGRVSISIPGSDHGPSGWSATRIAMRAEIGWLESAMNFPKNGLQWTLRIPL